MWFLILTLGKSIMSGLFSRLREKTWRIHIAASLTGKTILPLKN
jgi:hypothetical protein